MKDEAQRVDRADEPDYERREPRIGTAPDVPAQGQTQAPPAPSQSRADGEKRPLRGYALDLAQGESMVDNIEVADTIGLNHLVLTDRRLIVYGRDHQTVYPLRAISRLSIVKYIRWWMVALGVALGAAGAAGAFMPTLLFPLGSAELIYVCGALFFLGVALIAVALLRPQLYVEITSLGGDMRLRLTRNHEALADFVNSLAQRIR